MGVAGANGNNGSIGITESTGNTGANGTFGIAFCSRLHMEWAMVSWSIPMANPGY